MSNAFSKMSRENRRDAMVIIKILAPLIFIIFVAAYFHAFIVNAVEANLAINLGIIGAASFGVILIMVRLIGAQGDFRVIERFGREASQGVYMKTLLDEPWLKRRYVRHYLAHIANTGGTLASQMDQSAIESELHALQVEYDSKLEFPQFLVGFMIAMGLLGTFIGLLETLTGISGMLDGMGGTGTNVESQFMKLVVELRKPLAGMGIAFSASMFGLVTSLMLAVMMTNLRRYINRVMSIARNVMHDLTELTRGSTSAGSSKNLSPDDIAAMALEVQAPVVQPASVSNTLIAGRFDLLSKKIELLLGAFETSIATTQKMTDLLGFGPRMKELSERTLEELKVISAKDLEHQKLLETLIEINGRSAQTTVALLEGQRLSKEIDEGTLGALKNLTLGIAEQHQISRQIVDGGGTASRIMASILDAQKQTKEVGDQSLAEMRIFVAGQLEQRKLLQNIVDHGGGTVRSTESLIDAQKQGRVEIAALMQSVGERLAKVEEASLGGSRHLFEIKENFTKLCKSLGVMDLIASGVSGQMLLLETMVEEARISQKTLVSLQEDIKGRSV